MSGSGASAGANKRGRRRFGVLGGTFNPIHVAHLIIAEDVREALALERVVFAPAAQPWMKADEPIASAEDRWEMTCRAIQDNPRFEASRVDLERPGPSYAVDTVRELLKAKEGPREVVFIMGVDTLMGLPQWHEPRELLRLCEIAAVGRPGYQRGVVLAHVTEALPEAEERIIFVESALLDVSATDVRQRVAEGRSIRYRVPEAVERYIMDKGLYR